MKIRFIQTRVVEDERQGTADEERYEKGEAYDLPEPSAQRWIDRGVAIRDDGPVKASTAKKQERRAAAAKAPKKPAAKPKAGSRSRATSKKTGTKAKA